MATEFRILFGGYRFVLNQFVKLAYLLGLRLFKSCILFGGCKWFMPLPSVPFEWRQILFCWCSQH